MKTIALATFVLGIGQAGIAQSPLSDVFPMALGNTWVYDFNTFFLATGYQYAEADTGSAELKIIGVTSTADSNRWQFIQRRNFLRYQFSSFPPPPPVLRSDSNLFELIESTIDSHVVYTPILDIYGPFPLAACFSPKLSRYRVTDSTGHSVLTRHTSGQCGYWPYNLDMLLCRDTGIVRSTGAAWPAGGGRSEMNYAMRMFFRDTSSVSVEGPAGSYHSFFSLGQNFPNPFNPMTKIVFHLPERLHVTLSVYDLVGRQTDVLCDASMEPGEHEVTFNGGKHATGIYFYRLHAGYFVQTGKMTLVK